jgi:hypothetical protein
VSATSNHTSSRASASPPIKLTHQNRHGAGPTGRLAHRTGRMEDRPSELSNGSRPPFSRSHRRHPNPRIAAYPSNPSDSNYLFMKSLVIETERQVSSWKIYPNQCKYMRKINLSILVANHPQSRLAWSASLKGLHVHTLARLVVLDSRQPETCSVQQSCEVGKV